MMHLKRLCCGLALFPALASCLAADADPSPPDATARSAEVETGGGNPRRPGSITVMTRNQYLGADLTPIIAAPDAAAFNREALAALDQIAANHFPERAFSLALEIALQRPDAVGLQEVFDFRLNGAHGAPPYRDHLADTLQALSLLGQHYTVAAQVQNLAVTIPIDTNGDGAIDAGVNVLDRDVILVRDGVTATPVPYSALCARPSLDGGPGCNYQVVVTAPSAVGPLAIERGFVGVDLTVNGRAFRFVDTHLEVPDIDPTNPLSAAVQAAQAQELIAILGATSPADRKLIVVGDINSSPKDVITQVGGFTIVPPYIQLAAAGFSDSFVVDPRVRDGFTCCQAEDLRNVPSTLNQRIDVIVSRERPASASDEVVGSRLNERTPINHLWPSDHAGVVARLQF